MKSPGSLALADPDSGFADPPLSDDMPAPAWQRARTMRVRGGDVISGGGGNDGLAGGARGDTLGGPARAGARSTARPSQIGSGRQAEFDGDIASGQALGGLASAAQRVVGSLFGGPAPQVRPAAAAVAPTAHARPAPTHIPPRLGANRYGTGPLLGFIPIGEGTAGADGYDMTFNNGDGKHYPPGWRKPTQLTIDEAIRMEPDARRIAGDYAVGKYQFKPNTLKELKGRMGLKGSE